MSATFEPAPLPLEALEDHVLLEEIQFVSRVEGANGLTVEQADYQERLREEALARMRSETDEDEEEAR